MSITIEIDVAWCAPNAVPTYADLVRYKISHMAVETDGPAGGNPELRLTFPDLSAAMQFMVEWYKCDDPQEGDDFLIIASN